jgi:hypothetical protein
MISLQDVISKTQQQRNAIHECLQRTSGTVGWHPEDASIYDGLNAADTYEVSEFMRNISLAELLVKGSSAQGADDIVAAKLHDTLIYAAKDYDLAPLIGYTVTKWAGSDLKVNIVKDGSYTPKPFAAGAKLPDVNASFVSATLTPVSYGLPIVAGNDMIDDNQYGLIQWHVEQAGKACAELSSQLALAVLLAPPDGDGTANTITTTTQDNTTYQEVLDAVDDCGEDQFSANTLLCTSEAYSHNIHYAEVAGGTAGDFGVRSAVNAGAPAAGFDFKLDMLDAKLVNYPCMHDSTDLAGAAFTTCKSVVFDRRNALLTGRKRWLEVKNFSNPFKDISGAVVSFRQDSVTLYKDAGCVLTEHT